MSDTERHRKALWAMRLYLLRYQAIEKRNNPDDTLIQEHLNEILDTLAELQREKGESEERIRNPHYTFGG